MKNLKRSFPGFSRQGFVRIRLNGVYFELEQENILDAFDRKRKNELLLSHR